MAIVSAENVAIQAQGFGSLPAFRQVSLLVGLGLSIALGVTVAMWSQTPNYTLLYSNLTAKDLSHVTSVLNASNIDYKLEGGAGVVLIPADKMHEARMKLATQGMTIGGSNGYELLDKEQGLGTSSFLQKARYHRAIEGELAKSIGRLSFIEGARVHLAVPKQSAFARKNAQPTASVVLNVLPGRVLDDAQVAGIVNMVASSVPGLDSDKVSVIDHKGRLLTKAFSDNSMMLSSTQFDYTRKLEDRYVQRIINIVSPITGLEGVRAQVVADIDFTSEEYTKESYQPDQKALRSEQLYEQNTDQAGATGIPGALSNTPPAGGVLSAEGEPVEQSGLEQAASEPKVMTGNNTSRAVRNYELDRTISHTRQSPVTLKKLSVAVVVDYKSEVGKKGKVTKIPLTEEEVAYISSLVKETVGLDETRGDTINVVNTAFLQPEAVEPLPEPAIWEQPWVWDLAKQGLGGLAVLFIAFGVLRPMLKNLSQQGKQVEEAATAAAIASDPQQQMQQLPGGGAAAPGLPQPQGNTQQLQEMATTMAKEDPQRVAQVMNTWVAADE